MNEYKVELNELKEMYKSEGYEVVEEYALHLQVSTVINDEIYCILIIAPHEGNNYHWIVRADPYEYHDRWSNTMWGNEFETYDMLKKNFLHWNWNMAMDEWKEYEAMKETTT